MKRKWVCEIDDEAGNSLEASSSSIMPLEGSTVSSASLWLKKLQNSKKTCTSSNGVRRVKYVMEDGAEMLEEYSLNTSCLTRRAWRKAQTPLGGPPDWVVEVGDAPPAKLNELEDFKEANDQPIISKRNTRNNLEWRIRNLPYPIEVYSVAANPDNNSIIIKTTNKKYYKKLDIPELDRIGLIVKQANIEYSHKFNTLIVAYKKPQELKDFEKSWYEELNKIETTGDNPIDECKTS